MTNWSIQPSGVVAVLSGVNIHAEALAVAVQGLGPALDGAVTATHSAAISEALQSYFELEEGPRIEGMNARITVAASGVVSATEAYVAGDLEMAATVQAASVAAIYPPHLNTGLM